MASHDAEQACIFLPGIIAPAVVRYAALIGELGSAARAYTKELEVYTLTPTPHRYSIGDEIDGLLAHTSRAGLERFHLYGHSGGGAVALAFTAAHPQRVLSLTLDEAAFDFSAEMRAQLAEHDELREGMRNDPANAMRQFMQLELKPGVEFSPPAGGPPPLPNRPGGVAALVRAFLQYQLDDDALRAFDRCSTHADRSAPTATNSLPDGSRHSSPTSARSSSTASTTSTPLTRPSRQRSPPY